MTPEQIRAELTNLAAQAASLKTEAIHAQHRAHNPWMTDSPAETLWAVAAAAEEAWLVAMDLEARCRKALTVAVVERDRVALGLAVERYEAEGDVA